MEKKNELSVAQDLDKEHIYTTGSNCTKLAKSETYPKEQNQNPLDQEAPIDKISRNIYTWINEWYFKLVWKF